MSYGPDIQTNVSGISTRLLVDGKPVTRLDYVTGNYIPLNSSLEVELVRDARPLSAGSLAGQQGGNPSYFYMCTNGMGAATGYCSNNPMSTGVAIALSADVKVIQGSCTAPSQNVALPKMPMDKLKGVGSTGDLSGTREFELRFNNCPPGFTRVGYTLNPVGGVASTLAGTLPVLAGSTAKGVAIQITDSKGTPATFDKSLQLNAYSSSNGGSYAIQMIARYIQTGALVAPGTTGGMMSVLIDYQ
ncbi:fimbrial protein [Burkholderia sp. BE12]|uniref:fimbrial protein n=1 Tax=Burkholderia sp. BE12 TaxID=2082394 RepID=UPI00131A00B1|nr:fimbrial protein [Burkholderia sp. BE12]